MSEHVSVLLSESIDALAIKPDGIYIDATFGRGGHSRAILDQLGPQGRLIAIDKDLEAIKFAEQEFAGDNRFTIVHSSFAQLDAIAAANHVMGKVNGILLDLGVSSPQLDNAERGFSFMQAGPLDMRMNRQQTLSAEQWLNSASEEDIANVLFEYGEERYSRRLAKAIVTQRNIASITTTEQLAEIVKEAHPKWDKHKHPATRTFQAIRIFINDELQDLKQLLQVSIDVLHQGGRLVVISFHSLEDRIVKQFMRLQSQGPELPRHLPVTQSQTDLRMKRIGKAIKPKNNETESNVRSRSAVLRVAERV